MNQQAYETGRELGALVYDIEIVKAIMDRKNPTKIEGIEYCKGWGDHEGMGVSVVGVYDYVTDRTRVFCHDNLAEFFELASSRTLLVGFNNLNFDNKVLSCWGTLPSENERYYDILREEWSAVGLGPNFSPRTHGGYGLDATCAMNGLPAKSGNGALAPVHWQQGKVGSVVDYCLNDVRLTTELFNMITMQGFLWNPKHGAQKMNMRNPIRWSNDHDK